MSYVTGAVGRALKDKDRIDALLQDTIGSGRLSYILKVKDPYSKILQFLRESKDDDLHDIILRHRMYVEIKAKEVLDNIR